MRGGAAYKLYRCLVEGVIQKHCGPSGIGFRSGSKGANQIARFSTDQAAFPFVKALHADPAVLLSPAQSSLRSTGARIFPTCSQLLLKQAFHEGQCKQVAAEGNDAAPTVISPLLQAPGPPGGAGQKAEDRSARAVQRFIRMAPKKLDLFMPLIRRRHIMDALAQCRVSIKKAARLSEKVLKMAYANAVNNHNMDGTRLRVDLAEVSSSGLRKRPWIHARGRTGVRHKRFSQLTVVLKESDAYPKQRYRVPLMERRRKGFPPLPHSQSAQSSLSPPA